MYRGELQYKMVLHFGRINHLLQHLLVILGVLLVKLNLGIFAKGNLPLHYISPSTWDNQRGREAISRRAP